MANEFQILGAVPSSSAPTPADSSIPRFSRHEILTARVLQSLTKGTTLLSIKGRQVPVKTHVRLHTGQSVTLRVKSLSPAPILQLVAETGPQVQAGRFATLLNALAENTWKLTWEAILQSRSGQPLQKNLRALIQDISQGLFRDPGSDLLNVLISNAGFSLESKLKKAVLAQSRNELRLETILQNDLKALLFQAIGQQTQPQKQLKQLLSVIENFQLLNQEGLQKGGRIFVPIPMQFEDGFFTVGQLLITRDQSEQQPHGRDAAAAPIYTARLQLTLSRLGTVRAEVQLCAKRLNLHFLASNSESKALIEHELRSFMQKLDAKGFEVTVAAGILADSGTDMEDLISEFMPKETNILCLTA